MNRGSTKKKKLLANVHIDMRNPFPWFTFARILMDLPPTRPYTPFCDSEMWLLTYFLRKIKFILFLKSFNKLSIVSLASKLEEVDQQPCINISVQPVPHLVKMNNIFGQYLQCGFFQKPLISISMSSDHRDGSTIRFFFHLNNQTSLYRWFY